jgi:type IV pilus assembly protein PilA
MKKIRQLLKNQKGLTLVELLAVVVILGIIAAIAVPSIGGIIDNSKKDAHVANAEQMVAASRMALASNDTKILSGDNGNTLNRISLKELIDNGYLEGNLKDPDSNAPYNQLQSYVDVDPQANGTYLYSVTLKGSKRGIVVNTSTSKIDRDAVNTSNKAS